jgi:transposase
VYFRTKSIKGTSLLQLIRSYRNEEGQPRQRVITSLGDAQLPDDEKTLIAKAVESQLKGEPELGSLMLSKDGIAWVDRIVKIAARSKGGFSKVTEAVVDGVLIDQIETENVVELGPELVALKAWGELELDETLAGVGMNPSQIATAKLMVSNRLIHPLSEWALIDWSTQTALPELLGTSITKTGKNRLYKISDQLFKHRKVIEKDLRDREKNLFGLKRSIILYDVTNTHFEGLCQSNPKAKHGKNKQKRNDCRQVSIGVAFDEHGCPLANEIFEGNMADTKTLSIILDRLDHIVWDDQEFTKRPIVILDAGFASKENLQMLKDKGYSYLINITRGSREKYADSFKNETFKPLPGRHPGKQVEVAKITDPEDEESQLVLCQSEQRANKEQAMLSNAEKRFLDDAGKLKTRIEQGKLVQPKVIERNIGSLQKKHPRVRRFYTITHKNKTLEITRKDEKFELAESLCGNYVLKTNESLDAEELWTLYMTLLKAEEGFAMLKGSLGLRPNFHQLEHRVEGHIFISILAYHLLTWVKIRLEESDDHRDWKTIRRLLGTHSLVTTRVPINDGSLLRIRKPSLPDTEQASVYAKLGIDWRSMCPSIKTKLK